MKIKDILQPSSILGELSASEKKQALDELSRAISPQTNLPANLILQVLLEREKLGSTGLGNGIAIPHGKIDGLSSVVTFFARSKKGIDFEAHDSKPATLFFVLLAPENAIGQHLQALARLSRLLKNDSLREQLEQMPSEEIYSFLIQEDEKI